MTEPDVALTDFALAVECVALAMIVLRGQRRTGAFRRQVAVLYLSVATGAILGGISHGFMNSYDSAMSRFVWSATMLSLGVTALAVWFIAAEVGLFRPWRALVRSGAAILFVCYVFAVLFVTQSFLLAVMNLVPALIFLLAGFVAEYRSQAERYLLAGIFAIALVLFSSVLQQMQVGLHPVYLTYNALYHVLQGLAFFMLFKCLEALSKTMREP